MIPIGRLIDGAGGPFDFPVPQQIYHNKTNLRTSVAQEVYVKPQRTDLWWGCVGERRNVAVEYGIWNQYSHYDGESSLTPFLTRLLTAAQFLSTL